jgi:hypothetical protein
VALKRLPSKTFFERHVDLGDALFYTPADLEQRRSGAQMIGGLRRPSDFQVAVLELQQTAFGRILQAAAQENSPEAFKELLETFLVLMKVSPPEGVFARSRRKSGRSTEEHTLKIWAAWEAAGRPSTIKKNCANIVATVFPNAVKPSERSKKIALVRTTISRYKQKNK